MKKKIKPWAMLNRPLGQPTRTIDVDLTQHQAWSDLVKALYGKNGLKKIEVEKGQH